MYGALTLFVAFLGVAVGLLGVIVSFVAFFRTRRLDAQQLRLQAKQEELTELQLQQLRRTVEEQHRQVSPPADVRVTLGGHSRNHRFVITNWGEGPARNVMFTITSPESSPLVRGDYDRKLPIPELLPGDRVTLLAALTQTSGTTFDATLTWTDADGTDLERNVQVSLS